MISDFLGYVNLLVILVLHPW